MMALEKNTLIAFHLRSPSVSGGKDWIGSVTDSGVLHTYWGKTGRINQHASKAGSRTLLLRIVQEQLNKGYRKIDEYEQGKGWLLERGTRSKAAPVPPLSGKEEDSSPAEREVISPPETLIRDGQQILAWDF